MEELFISWNLKKDELIDREIHQKFSLKNASKCRNEGCQWSFWKKIIWRKYNILNIGNRYSCRKLCQWLFLYLKPNQTLDFVIFVINSKLKTFEKHLESKSHLLETFEKGKWTLCGSAMNKCTFQLHLKSIKHSLEGVKTQNVPPVEKNFPLTII